MLSSLQVISRDQERVAASLATVAGFIDAYAYINYRTYVSFMSGNTTQMGIQLGQGNLVMALPAILAILFFVIGVFVGTLLADSGIRQPRRLLLGLVGSLLALVIIATQLGALANLLAIVMLSSAMGLMNTAQSYVGLQSVNLVFVTGTLNTLARHLALAVKHAPLPDAQGAWDTHTRRALLLIGIWASFFIGALVAGLTMTYLGTWVLLLPMVLLMAVAMFNTVPE